MKTNRRLKLVGLVLLFIAAACAGGSDEASMPSMMGGEYPVTEEMAPVASETEMANKDVAEESVVDNSTQEAPVDLATQRKLIRNAYLSFKTDSLEAQHRKIKFAVNQFGAYIENEEEFVTMDRRSITTLVRVPEANFDLFLEAATQGVDGFDSKTIQVQDVTEEYVDVEARIKTKKELKDRFIGLLSKANSIGEIMEIEHQIGNLQAEIESYEGRLKYLKSNISYSNVSLTYYQEIPVPMEYDNAFISALSNGWTGLVWFFVGLLTVWPLWVILGILFYLLRLNFRKRKLRNIQK
jgi:hypothetical protein